MRRSAPPPISRVSPAARAPDARGFDVRGAGGRVVGVWGASGGVGATCLTVALAVRAAASGASVACVALDPFDTVLDAVCDRTGLPGLRWGHLGRVSGRVDGGALFSALPVLDPGVRLLAGGVGPDDAGAMGAGSLGAAGLGVGRLGLVPRLVAESLGDDAPADGALSAGDDPSRWRPEPTVRVLAGLAEVVDLVVLDCGTASARPPDVPVPCHDALLVVAAHVPGLARAASVTPWWSEVGADRAWALVRAPRGRGDLVRRVADGLDLPLLAASYDDPGVDRALARGLPPGGTRGGLRDCADAVLRALRDQEVAA